MTNGVMGMFILNPDFNACQYFLHIFLKPVSSSPKSKFIVATTVNLLLTPEGSKTNTNRESKIKSM